MWYSKTADSVIDELKTNRETGLSREQTQQLLEEFGPNELPEPERESLIIRIIKQFTDLLVVTLIVATVISFALGEYLDAIVILVIVVINGVLGFVQEYKAEKSLEALKKMSALFAIVLRDGEKQQIAVTDLVPGDVVILTAGDKVPADARIIETFNLATQEAILTGESLPVDKTVDAIERDHLALGDQKNMVFKDTIVSRGQGTAVVVATGEETEVGKISTLLASQEKTQTPLQAELNLVGKRLSLAAGIIILIVFAVGIWIHTAEPVEMFLTAVALAVAAIPEGLPAVVTIVLSLGVTRMASKNAIVKKLPAVETLGATAFICSDKTGTLTQNKIRVAQIVLRDIQGSVADLKMERSPELQLLLTAGVLNSDASITEHGSGELTEVGDQTEVALLIAAKEFGVEIEELRDMYEMLYEIPFDSENKYMVTVHQKKGSDEVTIFVKGAPEVVLDLSNSNEKTRWQDHMEDLAHQGLRTLGFGYRTLPLREWEALGFDHTQLPQGINFIGLVGERDPLRPEAAAALQLAKEAGIRTVMITGDHKLTAFSIAKELQLVEDESQVMTGVELANISDDELIKKLEHISVYARVNPDQKLRLVKLIQKEFSAKVAVTGDGVNDAPAIKAGDIGVAMGIEGTDVTREVADLVLEDDNYATIVKAVEEGRIIYANLVKFIRYLISCNISEIFIVFFAILLGFPSPLLPIQLLWVNLVTDGLPALALGMDPAELDVMSQPPRNTKEGILTRRRWRDMVIEGFIMGTAALLAFLIIDIDFNDDIARTVAFTTLSFSQLVHALNNRSEHISLFKLGLFTNKILIGTVIGSAILQLLVIYSPVGNLCSNPHRFPFQYSH